MEDAKYIKYPFFIFENDPISAVIIDELKKIFKEFYSFNNYVIIGTKNKDLFNKIADNFNDIKITNDIIIINKVVGFLVYEQENYEIIIDTIGNIQLKKSDLNIIIKIFELLFKYLNITEYNYYNIDINEYLNNFKDPIEKIDFMEEIDDNNKNIYKKLKFNNIRFIKFILNKYK